VVSPYAERIDDAYVSLWVYIGIPLLLISSMYALAVWWKTQIKGERLEKTQDSPWKKRMKVALGWLDWL
jgi:hypothetical protein